MHYVRAPFDPWNQPEWFRKNHHQGNNTEIAYRFFLIACQPAFQKTIEAIINTQEGGVLVHCHSGKDRTGLLIGAVQFLLDCTKEAMLKDYLASKADTTKERFDMLYEAIEQQGSVENFFSYQGINLNLQQALKNKLLS